MKAKLTIYLSLWLYAHAQVPPTRNCNNEQFECDDGECLPKASWCYTVNYYGPHYEDCSDRSNRNDCSQTNYLCFANHTHCSNDGKCIPLKWICDGLWDCSDGSDETDCINGFRIEGIREAKEKARNWIIQQRKFDWGWMQDSTRPIIALRLSNLEELEKKSTARDLMIKQLKIQLSKNLLRYDNISFPIHKLAQYVHSFIAACQDPRHILGKNLIEELWRLSELSTHLNPFVTLVLCNSNYTLSSSIIGELIKIIIKPSQSEAIDLQAYAALTVNCLRRKNSSFLDSVYRKFLKSHRQDADSQNVTIKDWFKSMQKKDGSFGNIYTTALVMQALTSSGNYDTSVWDPIKAYNYILQQQKLDGSFHTMVYTYLILPLLHGNSLIDLNHINCSLEEIKLRNLTIKEEFESKGIQKQRVQYSIWLNKHRDVTFTMSMVVPVNITFYDVMCLAAELVPKYSFQYTSYEKGKYVYSIFGTSNDPEARTYWKLYRIEEDDVVFAGEYPDKVFCKDGESFVYWYKHHRDLF